MRHAYTGERVPALLPTPLYEGWLDGAKYELSWRETLYRFPWWKARPVPPRPRRCSREGLLMGAKPRRNPIARTPSAPTTRVDVETLVDAELGRLRTALTGEYQRMVRAAVDAALEGVFGALGEPGPGAPRTPRPMEEWRRPGEPESPPAPKGAAVAEDTGNGPRERPSYPAPDRRQLIAERAKAVQRGRGGPLVCSAETGCTGPFHERACEYCGARFVRCDGHGGRAKARVALNLHRHRQHRNGAASVEPGAHVKGTHKPATNSESPPDPLTKRHMREHKAEARARADALYRCQLPDARIPGAGCGALERRTRLASHIWSVHGRAVPPAEVETYFERVEKPLDEEEAA